MRAEAISVPAASATAVPSVRRPTRADVDALILPALRSRVRDCFWFLALSQSVYAGTLLFSQGPAFETRAGLNLLRLGVLFGCVRLLGGEGSRRQTLVIAMAALLVQFGVGVAISVARLDVLPMAMLVIALTCVTAALVPWGGLMQGIVCSAAGLSLAVASWLVYERSGEHLGFDPAATIGATLVITTYIAHFLDRSRRLLEERLDEAHRSDEELTTLRSQLERRVAERTAELEMANRELEGFSYTVSHDLRSPLRTIGGFSQVILDESGDRLDEASRSNLRKIRTASNRMDSLIDDMLLLARVGRSTLRYETVDLAALARSIGDELAAEFPERNVELVVKPVPPVPGDHRLLRVALDNLLRNAWKFTAGREVAHVTVFGERAGASIICRVRDDGVGFDPRFRHKLFQPFERIHPDSLFPGTGVGLATVARIVRRHGGDVAAEGTPGEGATFALILPAVR
jgi:signal transduction histidine kinase